VRDRTLIVLTDGNDTGSQVPPSRAAEIARDRKITIHTVAVGHPAAGEEKLDEETLSAIARTTGGRYSRANDRAALADVYAQLDALRTREAETISHRPRVDEFAWPLAEAFLVSLAYHLAWALRTVAGRRRDESLAPAPEALAVAAFGQVHFLRPWWLLGLVPAVLLFLMLRRRQDTARPWRGVIADHLLPYLLTRDGEASRLTRTAPGVPGLAFPPLRLDGVPGLGAYAAPPIVRDDTERGEFTGRRIDEATYVCERRGTMTLPAVELPWWNVTSQRLETLTLPGATIEVAGYVEMSSTRRLWWIAALALLAWLRRAPRRSGHGHAPRRSAGVAR